MDELAKQVATIVGQLSTNGARIWPAMVQTTFITNLFWLIVDPIIWVGLYLAIKRWIVFVKQSLIRDRGSDTGAEILVAVLGSVFIFLGAFILCMNTLTYYPTAINGVLNPEAQTVLNLLKSK